jgi:hypothetical protein
MFSLLALLADQLSWVGNVYVSKGVDNAKESINGLKSIFIALSANAASLVKLGVTLQADFNSAVTTCPQINDVQQYIPAYQSNSSSYLSDINASDRITGDLNNVNDEVEFYAVYYRNIAFYLIWALAIFSIFSMVLWQLCKKKIMLKLSMVLGMITYCLEIIVTLVFMIVTSLTADICSPSPSYNIVRLSPAGEIRNFLSFYTSCVGVDVIGNSLKSAMSAINQIKERLQQVQSNGQCLNDQGIAAMQNGLSQISNIAANIESNLSCPNIRSLWFNLVNTGVCKNLYIGFYSIWISQLVTSFFVLLTILMASFAYQYFSISATKTRLEEHHQVAVLEHHSIYPHQPQAFFVAGPLPPTAPATSPTFATTGVVPR